MSDPTTCPLLAEKVHKYKWKGILTHAVSIIRPFSTLVVEWVLPPLASLIRTVVQVQSQRNNNEAIIDWDRARHMPARRKAILPANQTAHNRIGVGATSGPVPVMC